MIGETGERKSAVATPDGKSRKKKKKKYCIVSVDTDFDDVTTHTICFVIECRLKNTTLYIVFEMK